MNKFESEYSAILAAHPDLEEFTPQDRVVIAYREGKLKGMETVLDRLSLAQVIPSMDEASAWDEDDDLIDSKVRDA